MSGSTYDWLLDIPAPDASGAPSAAAPVGTTQVYDVDISCVDDLDPALTLVTDRRVLIAQRIARRLGTPRGGLIYDEDYGYDLRGKLNAAMTNAEVLEMSANIRAECLKEEGVLTARVGFGYSSATQTMRVKIHVGTIFGAFPLTLNVSDVTVAILHGES